MTTNEVVIQLAKFNDKSSTNNADWNNHTNESIVLNEGDSIIVSKAFLDTRDLASNNIVIQEDTDLELEFYFYWINDSNPGETELAFGSCEQTDVTNVKNIGNVWWQYPNPTGYPGIENIGEGSSFNPLTYTFPNYSVQLTLQSQKNIIFNPDVVKQADNAEPNIINGSQNVLFADGRPYLMCYSDNSPYTQTWKHTLVKGSYSPDQLASLLTQAMAEVKKDVASQLEKNDASSWFSSGQSFIANTACYPPVWAVSATTRDIPSDPAPEWQFSSLIDGQPYLQIDKVRGLPTADDWNRSTLGSSEYYNPIINEEPNGPLPPRQIASGIAPKPSLTFKNFISDAPIPNVSINLPDLPASTAISADEMVVNNYYQIVTLGDTLWNFSGDNNLIPAVGDKFVCIKAGTIPSNPPISVSTLQQNSVYVIQHLGNPWNGQYDTNWPAIGANPPNTIGQTFTALLSSVPPQIVNNPNQIDTINTFSFTGATLGYDLEPIGGPALPPTTITNVDINTTNEFQWVVVVNTSPPFRGINPPLNGVDYTQIYGVEEIPAIGTQYISNIDMINYNPTNLTLGTLNAVDIGMKIRVYNSGVIRWDELGYVLPSAIQIVNDPSIVINNYYIVKNIGISYGINNALTDTNWNIITGSATPVNVNDTIQIKAIAQNTSYTNATIYNVNNFAISPNPYISQRIIIISMGTSQSFDWIDYTNAPSLSIDVGTILELTNIPANGSLNDTGATFQILQNAYLSIGMTILPTNIQSVRWDLYTDTPVSNGVPFIITTIPNYTASILGRGTSFTPMNDTFQVIPTGQVQSMVVVTPFEFIVNKLAPEPFTDTSWGAYIIPVDIVYVKNYYQTIPQFKPTALLQPSSVINSVINGIVIPTGLVARPPYTQGTCIELFNPIYPNYYIYPLVKQQFLNELMYNPPKTESEIDSYWGGPCVSYAFPTIGSTEIELAFDDAKNRFIWNYTHSPIQQGEAPATAAPNAETTFTNVVGIINSFKPPTATQPFQSSTCKLTAQSGLMFKKMNPPNFWHQLLGFSENLLVTDDDLGLTTDGTLKPLGLNTLERFTYERFNSITTRDILSTAMNFNDNVNFPNSQPSYVPNFRANTATTSQVVGPVQLLYEPVINTWSANEIGYNFLQVMNANGMRLGGTPPQLTSIPLLSAEWFQALDQTISIQAIRSPEIITNEYGHYLISITGYGDDKNGLLNENLKIDSKAIVSNYYVNQGSFVSLTFPDSQVYTHVGESITLNNFSVRIIDPKNMQSIIGLGENTCVYIQVNKQYSKQELEQVTEV